MKLRIKELQDKAEIKNVDLAKALGLHNQQVAYYRSGFRIPPIKNLVKISEALGCHFIELFPEVGFTHQYNEDGEWIGVVKKP